jgi:hypothetical protein
VLFAKDFEDGLALFFHVLDAQVDERGRRGDLGNVGDFP